jgi:Fe-S cluster biogenesis protein NfuA
MKMKQNEKEETKLANIKEKVEPVIEKIRPMLQADGGDIELVNVEDDGTVKVRLVGACAGCAMSQQTLKHGVENILKKEVPEVKCVEQV